MLKKKGNSIIEVMVVIVVLTIGIVGAYSIISKGQDLARTTEKRIQAINIAREGLEAVQNIRDTNWLLFSSDYEHCWNVWKYQATCVGATDDSLDIPTGSYILEKDGSQRWQLTTYTTNSGVYLDTNGLPLQNSTITTICNSTINTNCKTTFTRTVDISFGTETMNVKSNVSWSDQSSKVPHTITLTTALTNWKINN